jgi:hypothetical protein
MLPGVGMGEAPGRGPSHVSAFKEPTGRSAAPPPAGSLPLNRGQKRVFQHKETSRHIQSRHPHLRVAPARDPCPPVRTAPAPALHRRVISTRPFEHNPLQNSCEPPIALTINQGVQQVPQARSPAATQQQQWPTRQWIRGLPSSPCWPTKSRSRLAALCILRPPGESPEGPITIIAEQSVAYRRA